MVGTITPKNRRTARVAPGGPSLACRSSTLAGDYWTSAPGLSPGRIQLGNPCSSAHLARGPPNRRDGRAIAASISTINPRVRREQDKRRSGSTFCAGYSPFPQDQPNAVINVPDEVQAPAAYLLTLAPQSVRPHSASHRRTANIRMSRASHIRSDNGPEFVANAVHEWLRLSVPVEHFSLTCFPVFGPIFAGHLLISARQPVRGRHEGVEEGVRL
jgi:hypothetical protein